MARLSDEVRQVQNPALGAMLLWRFTAAYTQTRADAGHPPLPLLFLVLPLVLHSETLEVLSSTQRLSGLRLFADKFQSPLRKSDVLLSLHDRAIAMRPLSLESLRFAIHHRLVALDPATGQALALTTTPARFRVPASVRELAVNAEKVGGWFGLLTLHEVSAILKVRF